MKDKASNSPNNLVSKHLYTFNKPKVEVDKKREAKKNGFNKSRKYGEEE